MSKTTYYERNREKILNRANNYYKNENKKLREKARNKCRELSEKGSNIKGEYGRNWSHKMSEEKKQRLKEYHKSIAKLIKTKSLDLMINVLVK